MMKTYIKHIGVFLVLMLLVQTSCDDGFAEINTDPQVATEINPNFQFTWTQLRTSGGRYENWRAGLIYSSMMVQHMAAVCGYWDGDKYTFNGGYNSSLFDRAFTESVRDIQDLINTLEGGEVGDQTMLGMARIWRVVIFHRLTDIYGDIPYFEAGKGVLEGIDFPAFDRQQSIYMDMLNELEGAVGQLGDGGFGGADLIYGGDVDKWRKFGNSLMLRLAMRLSEADAATAQAWAAKAIEGGLMNSNADDAFISHTDGPEGINRNGFGEVLDNRLGVDDCPRLSNTIVDWMSETDDPRLDIIGTTPENGGGHNGLPNGLDELALESNPTGTNINDFSRINNDLVRTSSPMFFMSYAESELLTAEAATRGWGGGNAADHYAAGVRAAMHIYAHYDASFDISDSDIDSYLANNPFNPSDAMRQIGWQYWAVTLLNEYEAFANLRRTGYPDLTPVNFQGNVTNGQIPSRLAYPGNAAGFPQFDAALSAQNMGNDPTGWMSVPVWWDK
jgi:hypothetical protein